MSQFTSSGFSIPFSCCSRWKQCDLGKKADECYYRERDPETMYSCRSYQRNLKQKKMMDKALDEALDLFDFLYG